MIRSCGKVKAEQRNRKEAGRQLGTTPALLLTGMVLGIACGAFGAYRQVRKSLKD
jgi:hypothetical protein